MMEDYRFNIIIETAPLTEDQILDAADAFADAGCLDASVQGHPAGIELSFDRTSQSLELAISTALANVESAGFRVSKVEIEREMIAG